MSRNFGLDIMRAVSIWTVLLQHAEFNLGFPSKMGIGGIGVEVFFVLSGFLIGSILVDSLLEENSIASLKRFWIRRWFRILPVYYLALTLKFIFIDNSIGWNVIYYYLFLQNNFYGINYYPVSWSLAIEEWFYIIAPIYLFIVIKFSNRNIKTILFYIVLFMIAINGMRFAYLHYAHVPSVGGNPFFRLDSLFVGVFFAFAKKTYPALYGPLQYFKYFFFGILICMAYLIYYVFSNTPDLFSETMGLYIFSLGIGFMIPYVETIRLNTSGIINRGFFFFITQTSLLTYSIYLIHPFIVEYIISQNIFFLPSKGLQQIVALFFVYMVSFIIYRFFEKPILNLREKFSPKSPQSLTERPDDKMSAPNPEAAGQTQIIGN